MVSVPIEYILLGAALLLLVSILASKVSTRLGIPALLLFLAIGMLAGSEGPGGIYFDDAWVSQFLGVVALVFILFAGGLDTEWEGVRPVPIILATFPLLAGVPKAYTIFNLVFFIVLFSVLLQGTTLGLVARWLKVEVEAEVEAEAETPALAALE